MHTATKSASICSHGSLSSHVQAVTLRKHNIRKLGAISFCLWCYKYIPFLFFVCFDWTWLCGDSQAISRLMSLPRLFGEEVEYFYACRTIIFTHKWKHVCLWMSFLWFVQIQFLLLVEKSDVLILWSTYTLHYNVHITDFRLKHLALCWMYNGLITPSCSFHFRWFITACIACKMGFVM